MVWRAEKTLAAIDAAILRDGGATFRQNLSRVLPHIADAYRGDEEDGHRSHLGVSGLGDECDRKLWYDFHWAPRSWPIPKEEDPEANKARMQRLWNRGHLEEGRIIALLLTAGMQVYQQDEKGEQFRVSMHGGHHGSALDGFIVGCPDLPPGEPAIGEFKTFSSKYWDELIKKGVRESNPKYYIQHTTYLVERKFNYGLFLASNKDTDALYGEITTADQRTHASYQERAGRLIFSRSPPARIPRASPGYWKCRYCNFTSYCFGKLPAEHNCRICKHGVPTEDGVWCCGRTGEVRDKAAQEAGCEQWEER